MPQSRGLSWLEETLGQKPPSPQNIDGPRSDRILWRDAMEGSKAIQDLNKNASRWPTFQNLLQDAFSTFFKPDPKLRDEAEVQKGPQANRPYVERLLEDQATAQTRTATVLDEMTSAVATLATGEKLVKVIEEDGGLDQAMRQNQAPPKQSQGKLQKGLHKALKEGAQEAQNVMEAVVTWGVDGGEMQRLPMGERIDMARKLASPQFLRIAKLIGRMRNLARSRQSSNIRHLRDEIHNITLGSELSRVLPSEISALSDPLRKLDFGRRFLEGQLLQYDITPVHREEKGPVICLIDASGSMNGEKLEWASAVGLALLDTAKRQKRDFAAATFDTNILAEFRFEGGKADPRKILEFATVGSGGGTDYETPLTWAMGVQQEIAKFKNADVTLISDGECGTSDAFVEGLMNHKKATGMRIFSILIGGTPQEMNRWSDRIWAVTEPDDNAASEMFAEMVSPHEAGAR